MENYVTIEDLKVAPKLYKFINENALVGTGIGVEEFWESFSKLIHDLSPENKRLIEQRDILQEQINTWHKENRGEINVGTYKTFLKEIGYLETEVEDFKVTTNGIDTEITSQAGPQLVVPVDNARYALNAANARWGSLFDALYGTDVISEDGGAEKRDSYNPIRGERVIAYAKDFLDNSFPLSSGSHQDAVQYSVLEGKLTIYLKNGETTTLKDGSKFIGFQGKPNEIEAILLKNNGLHVEIQIDHHHQIGSKDSAGVKDILVESAITTILDCEDSVAAVDASDKVAVYSNLLGLMKGDLSTTFKKGSKEITRKLNKDRKYISQSGKEMTLQGRSLMFVRNVGHLMTTNTILDKNGQEIPEGIMDGVITALIAKHDLLGNSLFQNSLKGSIYIVKPKMHGSKEVAFANTLFNRIEDMIGLKRNTLKIGVMDEERRTTLNLKNCIYEVKDRIAFINTGFLDRTGDEIHTSMEIGPMIRKNLMKQSTWLKNYEKSNVNIGLTAGFQGNAQIGKGMWAMPDLMAEMLIQKGDQLKAGANTAWVPSPTAATLHALHYHQMNVQQIQEEMSHSVDDLKDFILEIPVDKHANWSLDEIQEELENNAQSILGYVVRWIDQGIGCSKVPDIHNIGLMEDRATLRISSQHMANWLYHGVCTREQVLETFKRMAEIVDKQNSHDPEYRAMCNDFERSIAFQTACELVLEGKEQPSGYTEPILHKRRLEVKKEKVITKR